MARTGRPRAFDRDEAIIKAMHLFWQHGFEGVSLDQLRREMGGISSASFYAAFKSKEELYRETLEQYLGTYGRVMTPLRDCRLAPRDRIEQALRKSAAMQTATAHPAGCMIALASTICSEQGASVQAVTAAERTANRAGIRACITAAVDDGTLRANTDIDGLTALFDGVLLGLSIQARDGTSVTAIDAGIGHAMQAWDAMRSPAAGRGED